MLTFAAVLHPFSPSICQGLIIRMIIHFKLAKFSSSRLAPWPEVKRFGPRQIPDTRGRSNLLTVKGHPAHMHPRSTLGPVPTLVTTLIRNTSQTKHAPSPPSPLISSTSNSLCPGLSFTVQDSHSVGAASQRRKDRKGTVRQRRAQG
jgi:hypothetical protein